MHYLHLFSWLLTHTSLWFWSFNLQIQKLFLLALYQKVLGWLALLLNQGNLRLQNIFMYLIYSLHDISVL